MDDYKVGWTANPNQVFKLEVLKDAWIQALSAVERFPGRMLDEPELSAYPAVATWLDLEHSLQLVTLREWLKGAPIVVSAAQVLDLLAIGSSDPQLQRARVMGLSRKLGAANVEIDRTRKGQIVVGPKIYSREEAFSVVLQNQIAAGDIIKLSLYFAKSLLETSRKG